MVCLCSSHGVFPSSRVTGACPMTTDLIMRVKQQQLSSSYKLVQARTKNTVALVCSPVTSTYVRVQPRRAYVAAVCVSVSSYVLVRVRVLRVLCYLRPRLLSYLHGDLTQPPGPFASARETPTRKYVNSINSLGYLNCAQAKQYRRRRTCGLPMTRAEFMAATCMSA